MNISLFHSIDQFIITFTSLIKTKEVPLLLLLLGIEHLKLPVDFLDDKLPVYYLLLPPPTTTYYYYLQLLSIYLVLVVSKVRPSIRKPRQVYLQYFAPTQLQIRPALPLKIYPFTASSPVQTPSSSHNLINSQPIKSANSINN